MSGQHAAGTSTQLLTPLVAAGPLNSGFLRDSQKLVRVILVGADISILLISAICSHLLFTTNPMLQTGALALATVVTLTAVFALHCLGAYRIGNLNKTSANICRAVAVWTTLSILLFGIVTTSFPADALKIDACIAFMFIGFVGLTLRSAITMPLTRWSGNIQSNQAKCIVLGAGSFGRTVANHLATQSWPKIQIIGFLDDDPELLGTTVDGIPVLGDLAATRRLVDSYGGGDNKPTVTDHKPKQADIGPITQIWIALPTAGLERGHEVLSSLTGCSVNIHWVPDVTQLRQVNMGIDELAGLPVINVTQPPAVGLAHLAKSAQDKILAFTALVLVAPILLLCILLIRRSTDGPALFRQIRYGIDGRKISIWKLRTMHNGAHHREYVEVAPEDSRVTRIGWFLRKTSLDELPQLVNVLTGSMSLVGPRPCATNFVDRYRQAAPAFMERHIVKPGITGWAQVHGWRGETSIEKRLEYDLFYINNWSFWFDLKILVLTFTKVAWRGNSPIRGRKLQ